MKTDIHPTYQEAEISCACGHVIKTQATRKNMEVNICAKCHPFYTGNSKLVDTEGRVDRFKKRYSRGRR